MSVHLGAGVQPGTGVQARAWRIALVALVPIGCLTGCTPPAPPAPGTPFNWRAATANAAPGRDSARHFTVPCSDFPISGMRFSACRASDVFVTGGRSTLDCNAYQEFNATAPTGGSGMPSLTVQYQVSRGACGWTRFNPDEYYQAGTVLWFGCSPEGLRSASASTCAEKAEVVRLVRGAPISLDGRQAFVRTYELSGKRTIWMHEVRIPGEHRSSQPGVVSVARIRIMADPAQGSYQDAIQSIARSITFDRSIIR